MSSPKAATKVARRPSRAAKTLRRRLRSRPTRSRAAEARRRSGAVGRRDASSPPRSSAAFDGKLDAISTDAMQTLMGALCRVYAAQVENGDQVHADRGRTDRQPDRRHGDGERAAARRQSRGVRTRNVAELDGTLSARRHERELERPGETSWTLLLIAADASRSRS